jgi:hypothetical protein
LTAEQQILAEMAKFGPPPRLPPPPPVYDDDWGY